jgi:hypothetical protein
MWRIKAAFCLVRVSMLFDICAIRSFRKDMVAWGSFEVVASSWTFLTLLASSDRVVTIADFFCEKRYFVPIDGAKLLIQFSI